MTVWEVIRIISRDTTTRIMCGIPLLGVLIMTAWLVPCLIKCRKCDSETCIRLFFVWSFIAAAVWTIFYGYWTLFRDLVRYWRGVVRKHREEQYIL